MTSFNPLAQRLEPFPVLQRQFTFGGHMVLHCKH